ncbi:XRE family transcriptional regulator [Cryobacterium lactosi]|uniref:XRE family transcriptional regulator n=1 Tax=Cryobacterium lactosi TaxID=1259202 RepID=A0A4R9BY09_9MICO|nr:helix-turn-helix transcriptional regulator [Cryobacterium lactosi]TFD93997.1 XRE family transcriptional regulator [Cryobacterium lactosi]
MPMIPNKTNRTTDEWLRRIGAQLRSVRIDAGIEQEALARRASVSRGSLSALENGSGSSLRTLVKVARLLELDDWMDGIAEDSTVPSPLEQMAAQRRARRPRLRVAHGGK